MFAYGVVYVVLLYLFLLELNVNYDEREKKKREKKRKRGDFISVAKYRRTSKLLFMDTRLLN